MSCGTIWEHFTCIINRYTEIAFNRQSAYCRCTSISFSFIDSALIVAKVRFRTFTYRVVFDFFLGHVKRSRLLFIFNKTQSLVRLLHLSMTVTVFFFLHCDAGISSSTLRKMFIRSVPCLLLEQSSNYDCIVEYLLSLRH